MATTTGTGAGARLKKRVKAQAQRPAPASDEEIRILAYELYERRCSEGVEGDAMADWVEAERLLHQE